MILGTSRQVGHPVSTWRFLPEIEVQFHHLWLYDAKEACPPASLPVSSSKNRKSHICPRKWLWALYEIVPVITSAEGKGELPHPPTWWSPALCLFSFHFLKYILFFSSVIQLCPILQHHGLQHARLPCPSPTHRACSNSCPWSWWCHPTISSSVFPSPALSLSHHRGLFQGVSSLHQVAKGSDLQLQHQSFQWIFRTDFF